VLAKHGLQGTFYVPLRPAHPVLTEPNIRELASRFEIGGHTVQHVPVTRLSMEQAECEMAESRSEIERITGAACRMFCFPEGKHTRAHIRLARQLGYLGCRTVAMLSCARPAEANGIQVMPTTTQVFSHSRLSLTRNLLKRAALRPAVNWLSCGFGTDWFEVGRMLLDHVIREGGVFHLWGHSTEIDEQNQWERLDEFCRLLASYSHGIPCLTNRQICEATSLTAADLNEHAAL
jgi:peptidoglycan/xylan/chitin deacetylase (PgdA/CDA1 family)